MEKVTVTIVSKKRKLGYKIAVFGFLFLFVAFVISIVLGSDTLAHGLIILSFVAALISTFTKEYDRKGSLTLLKDKITVVSNLIEREFSINTIDNLEVIVEGFKGERYYSTLVLFPKNGLNNYLKFDIDGRIYSFEFLLLKDQVESFREIVDQWKQKKVDLKIKDHITP